MALEACALKKLDSITPRQTDLVILEPSKIATIPSDLVALISDVEFS